LVKAGLTKLNFDPLIADACATFYDSSTA